ncbi:MAG: phosphatidylglycerol lysyltransferase domain-containing protein, partial [Deferrisomatales bacterium]
MAAGAPRRVRGAGPAVQQNWGRRLLPALGLALFALVLWALGGALGEYRLADLSRSLAQLPKGRLALAAALAAANYGVLTGYDALALRHVGSPLPYPRVGLASFVGYAFANNTGSLSLLAAGGVRYRLYGGWGLSAPEVATVVGFCSLTYWLGFLTLGGAALVAEPRALPAGLGLAPGAARVLGAACLAAVGGYLAWSARGGRSLTLGGWRLAAPRPPLALSQVGLAVADWATVAAILFVLLPPLPGLGFPRFLGAFVLAQLAGLASTVPGGLGVFEGAMVLLLEPFAPAPALLGPLAAFRVVYYLLPLGAAVSLLGLYEGVLRRARMPRLVAALGPAAAPLVPWVFALATLSTGAALLAAAAPAPAGTPPALGEAARLAGAGAGAALVLLARGLQRRLASAHHLASWVLAAGAAAAALAGLGWGLAAALALVLAAVAASRPEFRRAGPLLGDPLSPPWTAAAAIAFGAAAWVGLLARGPGAGLGRAGLAAAAVVGWFALARLRASARPRVGLPAASDLDRAAAVAATAPRAAAHLALVGDKALLFGAGGGSFVMYGVRRRSWIALGDPAGDPAEVPELLWRFRELCDRHAGRPVFFDVGAEHLPRYLDLGLT